MHIEYHKWFSPILNKDIELKIYGSKHGKPVLVFPSSRGSFYQYEDFGMVEAVSGFIESGKITLYTIPCVDAEAFWNNGWDNAAKARRQNDFEAAVVNEVVPFIGAHHQNNWRILSTGCSGGAFHAVNHILKHPDLFDSCIALSGVYTVEPLIGNFVNEDVYYNVPSLYLNDLDDPWFLNQLRTSRIHIVVGKGEFDRDLPYHSALELSNALYSKGIPHWFDVWGDDVNHDWVWWRKQIVYHLDKMNL